MDKTYNNLMDIVHRTKELDKGQKKTSVSIKKDAEVKDPVEVKPKKKASIFGEESTIGKFLNKPSKMDIKVVVQKTEEVEEKKPAKKTTTKKSTAKKTTTKKSTTKKSASSTKKSTSTKKTTTKKAVAPVVKEEKKEIQAPQIDMSNPKNVELMEALKSTLFKDGTDISEYTSEEENKEDVKKSVSKLQMIKAKQQSEKEKRAITKEQQEYERLFTGTLSAEWQPDEEDEESTSKKDFSSIASSLNNLAKHRTTLEKDTLDIKNDDLDTQARISEYYKKKAEKIEKERLEQENAQEQTKTTDYENKQNEYEDIFNGPVMSREDLMNTNKEDNDIESKNVENIEESNKVENTNVDNKVELSKQEEEYLNSIDSDSRDEIVEDESKNVEMSDNVENTTESENVEMSENVENDNGEVIDLENDENVDIELPDEQGDNEDGSKNVEKSKKDIIAEMSNIVEKLAGSKDVEDEEVEDEEMELVVDSDDMSNKVDMSTMVEEDTQENVSNNVEEETTTESIDGGSNNVENTTESENVEMSENVENKNKSNDPFDFSNSNIFADNLTEDNYSEEEQESNDYEIDDTDLSNYIVSSNISLQESKENLTYDEDDSAIVINRSKLNDNALTLFEDEEEPVQEEAPAPVVEEEKVDNAISREDFYNEMARLQENLIKELKGQEVEQSTDLFEEKVQIPVVEEMVVNEDKAAVLVDDIIANFRAKEHLSAALNEEEAPEPVVEEEKMEVKPTEPEITQTIEDIELLGKNNALNESDLEYIEKAESPKEEIKDDYFYLSDEDKERMSSEQESLKSSATAVENSTEKEVGDINLNKSVNNAKTSSQILEEVNNANTTPVEEKKEEDKVLNIYTLFGITKKVEEKKVKQDLKVLYVATECVPFVATGGLADVAGSLPKAIAKLGGVDIRVILPLYGNIKNEYREKFEYLGNFTVHLSWRQEYCGLFRYYDDGVTYYFVDNERYFKRNQTYGFYDDGERFAYFSKAIVECLPHINFFPDIIHCNDWQSALVSSYIKTGNWSDDRYYKIKNIYTIHNIEYQGTYGMENLKDLFGIDYRFKNDMDYNGDINLTKAAIQYSDIFTTVSNSYCDDLKQPYCSRGLNHIIVRNEYKLRGILNGLDYEFYNPATDNVLYKNYDIETIENKVLNKKIWQEELGLPVDANTPMISMVSRLVAHKGFDLVTKVLEGILSKDVQLVVVGTGDQRYIDYFKYLEDKYPTKVRALVYKYSQENARKAYAASDIFLMPSKFEPCGISQMIASRYGAIPIVREVGGLKDTIKDFGCAEGGNGYTFTNYNPNDLTFQIKRALDDYADKENWKKKMIICMKSDFGWDKSAQKYLDLYKSLV